MAHIYERNYKSGYVTYRVTFRKAGKPNFCITFDDFDAACAWVEKNENTFYENPDQYFEWRKEIYHRLTRSRKKSYQHIIKPKLRIDSRS